MVQRLGRGAPPGQPRLQPKPLPDASLALAPALCQLPGELWVTRVTVTLCLELSSPLAKGGSMARQRLSQGAEAPTPELEKTAWAGRSEGPMTTHTGCGNTGWTIGPSQRHTDSSFPFTHSPYNGLHKVPEYSPEALLSIKLDFQHSPSAGSRRVGHD